MPSGGDVGSVGRTEPLAQTGGEGQWGVEWAGSGTRSLFLKEWTELRQPHIHGNRLRTNFIPCRGLFVSLEKVDKGEGSKRSRGRAMRAEVADARPVSAAPLTKKTFLFSLTAHINGHLSDC